MASGSKTWSLMSTVSALGAAVITRKALQTGWRSATGTRPPRNPADPDVQMWQAVAWSVSTGSAVALAKMLALRKAANYYRESTGHLPPPLQKDAGDDLPETDLL